MTPFVHKAVSLLAVCASAQTTVHDSPLTIEVSEPQTCVAPAELAISGKAQSLGLHVTSAMTPFVHKAVSLLAVCASAQTTVHDSPLTIEASEPQTCVAPAELAISGKAQSLGLHVTSAMTPFV